MNQLLMLGIIFIIVSVGLIAFIAPPNTYDSMTYHMSRIAHWIQNESVKIYPTQSIRQLIFPPGAEYIILHFQILLGNDRLANFVQWFSMLSSIIGITFIAKQLGANSRIQMMTAVLAATIPMGILQGSSTQNDYVASFWLISLVNFLLLAQSKPNKIYIIASGMALGLALLTKATNYLYTLPFLLWFFLTKFKMYKWQSWKLVCILGIITLTLNFGQFARNTNLLGSPLGDANLNNTTTNMTPHLLISNIIRHIGLNCRTIYREGNIFFEQSVHKIHDIQNIGITDIRSTYEGSEFNLTGNNFHEDNTANLLHTLLIIVCATYYIFKSKNYNAQFHGLFLCTTSAFLLLCYFLKWNPWATRYQLPLVILWTPMLAITLSDILKSNKNTANFICIFFLVAALPWVFLNFSRSMMGEQNIFNTKRVDQYFTNKPEFKNSFIDVTKSVAATNCREIALLSTENSWEYPLWVLLKNKDNAPFRLEHIKVTNPSAKFQYPKKNFQPCFLINITNGTRVNGKKMNLGGVSNGR